MTVSNLIHHGDCTTVLPNLEAETFHLSFVDPPFNQNKEYDEWHDNMPPEEYWAWMTDICTKTHRLTVEGGAIYFMQREKNVEYVVKCLREAGWTFQNLIIWRKKTSAVPSPKRFGKQFQIIVFATKGKTPRVFNKLRITPPLLKNYKNERPNGVFVTDVWDDIRELTSGYFAGNEVLLDNEGNRLHKQQSPLQLLLRIILSSTFESDMVLDPFSGTGTTLVVANQLNRSAIGVEIDCSNVLVARDRIDNPRKADSIDRFREDYSWTHDLSRKWGFLPSENNS